ncbi:MAG: hypothetical protein IBJ11_04070 [Phycisphaerales bacterium]|nr:hypothetical protein [Phycisphaerales bacterium]
MHILTKFLVVVAAVLSVLLSGLAIAYTSNADRLKAEVLAERAKAAEAVARAGDTTTQSLAERESMLSENSKLQQTITTLKEQINKLEGDQAGLIAENKRLQLNDASYTARIDQFTALIKSYQELDKARSSELDQLRTRALSDARKQIELGDRINDLTGQLEVSTETNRTLQEQLVDMRQELGRAREGGAAGAGSAAAGVLRAPPALRATVTSVTTDVDGSTLVAFNAGSTAGIRPNMEVNVVRPGNFVAKVLIKKVDLNEAVGRVTLFNTLSNLSPSNGDTVVAQLNNPS